MSTQDNILAGVGDAIIRRGQHGGQPVRLEVGGASVGPEVYIAYVLTQIAAAQVTMVNLATQAQQEALHAQKEALQAVTKRLPNALQEIAPATNAKKSADGDA